MAVSKSASQLLDDALTTLAAETTLTALGPEGIAYQLLAGPMLEISELWSTQEERALQNSLSTASDQGLDDIGELLGCPRLTATSGRTSSNGLRFWLTSAAEEAISIPAGTQVWATDNPSGFFFTRTAAAIPAGGTEAFTDCMAPDSGSYYLAAPGTLTNHNVSSGVTVYCTNLEAAAGTDAEDDANYQYRLSQILPSRNLTTASAIRSSLLAYPGVLDARVMVAKRGAGTIDVLIHHIEPVVNPITLGRMQQYAETLVSEGIVVTIVTPTIITLDLTARLAFATSVSQVDYPSIRTTVSAQLRAHINNLDVGQDFLPVNMQAEIASTLGGQAVLQLVSQRADGQPMLPSPVYATDMQRIIAGTIEVL